MSNKVIQSSSVLQLQSSVEVSAQKVFRAVDFFKEGGQPDGILMLIDDEFKQRFLSGGGKIELAVPAATLNDYNLTEYSLNGPILTALGGNDAAKTILAYVAQLLQKKAKGGEGVLLTNGWANIFYIEDRHDVLCTVYCRWCARDRELYVRASPVTDPDGWLADCKVFSPAALAT